MQTILVIEDSADTATMMQFALCSKGCRAHTANSRDEALEFIKADGVPDAIIMDFNMPGMSLEEFLRHLAAINPRLPRLILSTAGQEADETARRYNIPEVLRKPCDPANLLAQVDGCK